MGYCVLGSEIWGFDYEGFNTVGLACLCEVIVWAGQTAPLESSGGPINRKCGVRKALLKDFAARNFRAPQSISVGERLPDLCHDGLFPHRFPPPPPGTRIFWNLDRKCRAEGPNMKLHKNVLVESPTN